MFQTAEVLKQPGVTLFQELKKEQWGTLAIFEDPESNRFDRQLLLRS